MQVLVEAYFLSNFRYCPVTCIFCGDMSYSDNLIVKIGLGLYVGLYMIHKNDHMKKYYI